MSQENVEIVRNIVDGWARGDFSETDGFHPDVEFDTADPPQPLHIVAARLGDDPTTLLRTYSHLLPRSDAQAAETIAAIIVDKPLTETAA